MKIIEKPDLLKMEAAAWVVRLNSDQCTRADEAAFREWVAADHARAEAYAEHHAIWAGFGGLANNDQAREILLPESARRPLAHPLSRRDVVWGGAGAIAASVLAGVVLPRLRNAHEYRTAPGEQRTLHLDDGSVVIMNTASALKVSLSQQERRLILEDGQAYFQVAKDKIRPFRVFVGSYEVRAIGTAFDVRKVGDDAKVTLEEGKVAIYRDSSGGGRIVEPSGPPKVSDFAKIEMPIAVLRPRQEAIMAAVEPVAVTAADLNRAEAWRKGQIILDGSPLSDVVADLNRYGGSQIILADSRLNSVQVSGVFHTSRPDAFVEAITTAFPVRVLERSQDRIVLGYR